MKVTYIVYIILRPKRFIPASDRNKHIDDQTNFVCALITPQTNVIVSIYILPYMCVGGISIKFICFVKDVDSVIGTSFTKNKLFSAQTPYIFDIIRSADTGRYVAFGNICNSWRSNFQITVLQKTKCTAQSVY